MRPRQIAGTLVNASVNVPALYRLSGIEPLALHPFQIREPGTVLILVEHAHRQQRQLSYQLGKGQRKLYTSHDDM
jgi:hypothetical protein